MNANDYDQDTVNVCDHPMLTLYIKHIVLKYKFWFYGGDYVINHFFFWEH